MNNEILILKGMLFDAQERLTSLTYNIDGEIEKLRIDTQKMHLYKQGEDMTDIAGRANAAALRLLELLKQYKHTDEEIKDLKTRLNRG